MTFGGIVGSIDTISYDESYENAVKKFEAENPGYVVYHAIETYTRMGKTLSLLYVGADSDNWPAERLYGNYIFAYTVISRIPISRSLEILLCLGLRIAERLFEEVN